MRKNLYTLDKIDILHSKIKKLCLLNFVIYAVLLACMVYRRMDLGLVLILFPIGYALFVSYAVFYDFKSHRKN